MVEIQFLKLEFTELASVITVKMYAYTIKKNDILIAYSIFQVIEEYVVHNYIILQSELTSVACSLCHCEQLLCLLQFTINAYYSKIQPIYFYLDSSPCTISL